MIQVFSLFIFIYITRATVDSCIILAYETTLLKYSYIIY